MKGLKKFSINIFNDLPGALSSSASFSPVLSVTQKDLIYAYQIAGKQPWLLGNACFSVALIVDSTYQSKRTYEQLVKMNMLSAEGEVNTYPVESKGFAKDIMSKLAFLPQVKIKMIIDFLFWWIEEAQRLKKLLAEQQELTETLNRLNTAGDENQQDVSILLQQTKLRLATRPSRRDPHVEGMSQQTGNESFAASEQTHDLPAYDDLESSQQPRRD